LVDIDRGRSPDVSKNGFIQTGRGHGSTMQAGAKPLLRVIWQTQIRQISEPKTLFLLQPKQRRVIVFVSGIQPAKVT